MTFEWPWNAGLTTINLCMVTMWLRFIKNLKDPSDSYFLFADFVVDFYTRWTYMLIFLSNYWWQKSDIWSQASYRYPISWEAFLDPSDSYFLFADFVGFYNACDQISDFCHQQLLRKMRWKISWTNGRTEVKQYTPLPLGPIRFLLPVCRLCWFLYTLNIYAHFSSHFSQELLMAEIWYLVTSFI
jgi:hypothetical protein